MLPDDVSFVYPWRLWLLVLVGAFAVALLVVGLRRRGAGAAYADAGLLGAIAPRRTGWRTAPGQVLVLLALLGMTVAWAEPEALADNAREKSVVMVALDVSGSMQIEDIAPNRFEVAKNAVQAFVADLPDEVDVGLVTFAGAAELRVPPSPDHQAVIEALPTLELGPGTAQGDAILTSLAAIQTALPRVQPGERPAGRVVLLSDGSSQDGTAVEVGVSKAQELFIPISTIALGTDSGVLIQPDGTEVSGAFDSAELQATAEMTGGLFYEAGNIDTLDAVYAEIGSQVAEDTRREPLSAAVMGIALALLVAGALPTVLWLGRVP